MKLVFTSFLVLFYHVVCIAAFIYVKTKDVSLRYLISSFEQCFLGNDRISFFHESTITECVIECGLRPHCAALNFIERMKLCELFSPEDVALAHEQTGQCMYVKKANILDIQTPCENCEDGKVCDTHSKTCRYKECGRFPTLDHGKVLGNRKEVGMTIRYMCDHGLKKKQDVLSARCVDNGQWDTTLECVSVCKTGWVLFEESCYLFENRKKGNWTYAKEYCESEESALVKVATNKTHEFILRKLQNITQGPDISSWLIGGRFDNNRQTIHRLNGITVNTNGLQLNIESSNRSDCIVYYTDTKGEEFILKAVLSETCNTIHIFSFICEEK